MDCRQSVFRRRFLQRFASWISRYASICPILLPFTKVISDSFAGFQSRHVHVVLSNEARLALRLFRALFILSIIREDSWTRSWGSFEVVEPQFIIEFDASLFGGGVIFYVVDNDAQCEVRLGSTAFSLRILDFREDSSFQNAAEFIAAVIGVIVATKFCEKRSSDPVSWRRCQCADLAGSRKVPKCLGQRSSNYFHISLLEP